MATDTTNQQTAEAIAAKLINYVREYAANPGEYTEMGVQLAMTNAIRSMLDERGGDS